MWHKEDNSLRKKYSFTTFKQALNFVNKVAELAEQSNHHPDIYIHNYNQVTIQLTTHSEGRITSKDYHLAHQIDLL